MKTHGITTSTGTTVRIEERRDPHSILVIADNPDAPADMRDRELGRVIKGGFQPAPFAPWGLSPETLRAIADLIEKQEQP